MHSANQRSHSGRCWTSSLPTKARCLLSSQYQPRVKAHAWQNRVTAVHFAEHSSTRPENKKFRSQATVGEQVQTSVELRVRVPALKGRGRGFIIDLEPENQGSQVPDESCNTASTNNVMNADDVI
ncbi:hypothetical protein EPR50_G00186570 [Perca flavescens]|uniref:Uncharacterized protein n=1 Tax=Perca flavescens TaxID=8167 RepID=A0A484C987_PERFV|nr:hypothetical protein EPR50_G00186570 [Perca flavescens]